MVDFGAFGPQVLEMAMARLGIAAGQLKAIDGDTKKGLLKLLLQALASPDANAYLKERLAWIDQRENPPPPPPPPPPQPERPSRRDVMPSRQGSYERPPRRRR